MDFTRTKAMFLAAIILVGIVAGAYVVAYRPEWIGQQDIHGVSFDHATGTWVSITLPKLSLLDWSSSPRLDQFSDGQVEFRVTSMDSYNQQKAATDELITLDKPILEQTLQKDLGVTFPPQPPLTVLINYDGKLWGAAGGGAPNVQFSGGSWFGNDLSIAKGILLGESINILTGSVAGAWPADWWVDCYTANVGYCVWNFPTFAVYQILNEAGQSNVATAFLANNNLPVLGMFTQIKTAYGWGFYQKLFQTVTADGIRDWGGPGQTGNGYSSLLTNYVLAYMEIAAGTDLSSYINPVAGVSKGISGYVRSTVNAIKAARTSIASLSKTDIKWRRRTSPLRRGREGFPRFRLRRQCQGEPPQHKESQGSCAFSPERCHEKV